MRMLICPLIWHEVQGCPDSTVAFKFTPTPALPRCLSNKINTSLRSKEKPSTRNLTQNFHLWFALVCSITHYGKCPCVGELSPVTLKKINGYHDEENTEQGGIWEVTSTLKTCSIFVIIICVFHHVPITPFTSLIPRPFEEASVRGHSIQQFLVLG